MQVTEDLYSQIICSRSRMLSPLPMPLAITKGARQFIERARVRMVEQGLDVAGSLELLMWLPMTDPVDRSNCTVILQVYFNFLEIE